MRPQRRFADHPGKRFPRDVFGDGFLFREVDRLAVETFQIPVLVPWSWPRFMVSFQ
jgi:hypothetical protein